MGAGTQARMRVSAALLPALRCRRCTLGCLGCHQMSCWGLMQYKSMIFERWQRDPHNPRNQKLDA